MKMGKMSLKGYTSFVKKHMDLRGLGVVMLGLGLPSVASYLQSTNIGGQVGAAVDKYVPFATSKYGKAAMAITLTAGVSYVAASMNLLSPGEALTANMIALGLVSAGLLKTINLPVGNNFVEALPSAGMDNISGGSYGYIGNYHVSEGVGAEMIPAPKTAQMFGVRANVF